MRQIYNALLKMQQEIGNHCWLNVGVTSEAFGRPNLEITCWWPNNLAYRQRYTYDYIDKFGDPLRIFVEQARIVYEKEMGE